MTNELTFSDVGDYRLPNLCMPEQEPLSIGKYGLLRKTYLKTHRRINYINLLTTGKLYEHLADIDQQSNDRLDCLMRRMAAAQGVTESLKADNQMTWVGVMNNIKSCAEEIVLAELIYD